MEHKRVVVIGGGVVGCSVLYHLAKAGWRDLLLLERKELTSGSSWHAAGNLFALTRPSNAQRLQVYSIALYPELERESGQPLGFHKTGGLHLAASDDEWTTLANSRARALRNGVEAEWIDFAAAREMAPVLDTSSLKAILWEPEKGSVDPASATHAFAAAARKLGAEIRRHTPVTATTPTASGGWRVTTPEGEIEADVLVNAAGLWAREVAALAGIALPLAPVEHHYLVTEEVPEIAALDRRIPVITEAEAGYYSRQEGKGLLLGAYEKRCHHWALDGTPLDFGHELLPDDLERMEANFETACRRMPALGRAGVKSVVNGPMIFSPDLGPLLGPHPALVSYFCACGVMTGFNQAGGIGKTLAEWIIEGEPELDVNFWDVARYGRWAGKRFAFERTKYFYENRQERPYPHLESASGRPARTWPAYDLQREKGAVFGLNNGWENPLWYARRGDEPRDVYGYARQNWFETVGAECRAVREAVGLFEISTFAKYRVTGAGAQAWLTRVLAGRIPRQADRMALCPMLSKKGRLIGDLSAVRLGEQEFMLFGSGVMQGQHMRWFRANAQADAQIENLSDDWAGLMIAGPNARALLERVAWREDVSNAALPFLRARPMELEGAAEALALRVSFTGELGYELYAPAMYQRGLYAALLRAGEDLGLAPAGGRALGSLRVEKSFMAWGSELSPDYSVMEPGLDWAVDWSRGGFIGAEAAARAREAGRKEIFATLVVEAEDADCVGGEPIFRDGEYAGYVTSGAYGFTVGESLALGFMRPAAHESGAAVEVEINGRRRPARIAAGARHDPNGGRMRG